MIHVLTEGSPNMLSSKIMGDGLMVYPTFMYPKTILGETQHSEGMRRLTAITFLTKRTSDDYLYFERNVHTVEISALQAAEHYEASKMEFLKRFSAELKMNQLLHRTFSLWDLISGQYHMLYDDINARIYETLEARDSPHKTRIAHRHNSVTETPDNHEAVLTQARRRGRSHVNDAAREMRMEREREVQRIREEQAAEMPELVPNDRYILGMDPVNNEEDTTNPVDNEELARTARELFGDE